MKTFFLLFVLSIGVASGCTLNDTLQPPELSVQVQNINLCAKEVGVPYTWQNLQLRNTGEETLIVSNIELRGNSTCAFQCEREPADGQSAENNHVCPEEGENAPGFRMTIWPGDTRLVKIVYTASGEGVIDRADLVITSNGENMGADNQLVIPMCGVGVREIVDEACEDAGTADASCESDVQVECPECDEVLPTETPGCANI